VRSKARSVDEYLAAVPQERTAALTEQSGACLERLPDHEESVRRAMAAYSREGQAELARASQARHVSLHLMKPGVTEANREILSGLDPGRACLRLSPSRPLDMDLVRALLHGTAA
jgi:uncharacterized protein YdhG (YjbR/CyaY superfamily)